MALERMHWVTFQVVNKDSCTGSNHQLTAICRAHSGLECVLRHLDIRLSLEAQSAANVPSRYIFCLPNVHAS
jgi:hypothetical protein